MMDLRPMPRPAPAPAQGATGAMVPGAATMDPSMLAMILGSLQMPEQQRMPLPQATFPDAPRAMNPAFTQMILQAMQGASAAPAIPSLGQMLGGR